MELVRMHQVGQPTGSRQTETRVLPAKASQQAWPGTRLIPSIPWMCWSRLQPAREHRPAGMPLPSMHQWHCHYTCRHSAGAALPCQRPVCDLSLLLSARACPPCLCTSLACRRLRKAARALACVCIPRQAQGWPRPCWTTRAPCQTACSLSTNRRRGQQRRQLRAKTFLACRLARWCSLRISPCWILWPLAERSPSASWLDPHTSPGPGLTSR